MTKSEDFTVCPYCGCVVYPTLIDIHRASCNVPKKSGLHPDRSLTEALEKAIEEWVKTDRKLREKNKKVTRL